MAAPTEEKKGMFARAPPPPQAPPMVAEITGLNTRVRAVEEKLGNLNRKFELLENNYITGNRKQSETLKVIDGDMLEIKREFASIKQKIELIVKELKLTAGKDEINTIKRYLDLWNLTRFASREEVEKMIDQKIEEKLAKPEQT